MLRANILSTVLAVALARVVSQTVPELGGAEIPAPERFCTMAGEHCGGATGQGQFAYEACCDEHLICATPLEASSLQPWG
jgi:hypothetical protein